MRTLYFFTASFPFGIGEQFIETELPYLADRFRRIEILPLYISGAGVNARSVPDNVIVHEPLLPESRIQRLYRGLMNTEWKFSREEWWNRRPQGIAHTGIFLKSALLVGALLGNAQAMATVSKASADDVLYFYWGAGSCYLLPFATNRRAASVVRFHNSDLYEETSGGYLPFREAVLSNADYVVPISADGARYLRTTYPTIDTNPQVFRLGTSDFGFGAPSTDGVLRVCSCSSITEVKRVDLIARVLARVDMKIEWTHIGDGPLRGGLERMVAEMPIHLSVRMLGRISNDSVKEFYRTNPVDLFINFSAYEGIPVSIMEALSAGIPVFATDCGGVAELVDHSVGKLIGVDLNVHEVAESVEQFARIRDSKMREAARERWREKCSAESKYQEFASFLDDVRYRGQPV